MTNIIRKSVGGKILSNIVNVAVSGVQLDEGKNVEISNLNVLGVRELANMDLSNVTFKDCKFSHLGSWALNGATFIDCEFNEVLVNQEVISGATFTHCVFVDCEFIDCVFKGCNIYVSNVETNSDEGDGYGLSLAYSNLYDTNLTFSNYCKLSLVNIEGVNNNK